MIWDFGDLGGRDYRHQQDFSTRASPSVLDSGIPSNWWVLIVIIDTQSKLDV